MNQTLNRPIEIIEPPTDETGMEFFVSVIDGQQRGLLLGPFETHAVALENVDRGRKLAWDSDPKAPWYAYGTAGAPVGQIKKTVFGK